MKKLIAFILCFVYVATSSGATINFHYCMGRFIGWDWSLPINNKCSNCGMKKENQKGCCNYKHQTLQLKKDQLATGISLIPTNSFQYLAYHYYSSSITSFTSVCANKFYSAHSPPGLNTISPFILNCVFRI
ncbi:MAG TPA: hypothetical protein VEV62_12375 [Parafilimonas sp.]|nr:hypothetical protein [Parafilimonas sp.]